MDILICRIKYPNDPTGSVLAHQHFVGRYDGGILELYSISSIAGKEYKVYIGDGNPNPNYYLIIGKEQTDCNLRMPSFIDCTKSYILNITANMDISKLSNRNIPEGIREKIKSKIQEMKNTENHTEYILNTTEFITHNAKCKIV